MTTVTKVATVALLSRFIISSFQGDPGLLGPPGMSGRDGDDVSDISVYYYVCPVLTCHQALVLCCFLQVSYKWLCYLFVAGSSRSYG